MGRDEMRAADADRQAVADHLKSALEEGRLDLHEYDERLQQAYAAKTYGDLKELLSDLPVDVPAQRTSSGLPVVRGTADHVTRRWLVHTWSSYFPIVAVTTMIWLISSIAAQDLLYFWPVWVAGPWGIVLIFQTIGGLAGDAPPRWQAEIDKAERKKQAKKERKALEAEAIERGDLPAKPKKKSA
jgi:hypothetical protein